LAARRRPTSDPAAARKIMALLLGPLAHAGRARRGCRLLSASIGRTVAGG
jgi:hypothetical protein